MAVWKGLHNIVARISTIVVGVAAVSIFLGTVIGTADIMGTIIFRSPFPMALELTQTFMVLIVFGGFAYTQVRKSNIRVMLLQEHVGPRTRVALELLVCLLGFVFFALFTWQTTVLAVASWKIMEIAAGEFDFPLYPVKTIMAFGTAMMAIQLLLELVDNFIAMVKGRGTVNPA